MELLVYANEMFIQVDDKVKVTVIIVANKKRETQNS